MALIQGSDVRLIFVFVYQKYKKKDNRHAVVYLLTVSSKIMKVKNYHCSAYLTIRPQKYAFDAIQIGEKLIHSV